MKRIFQSFLFVFTLYASILPATAIAERGGGRGGHDGGDWHGHGENNWHGGGEWHEHGGSDWHGGGGWHGEHHSRDYDEHIWHSGYWRNGFHEHRDGWWWIAGGLWYWYPAIEYPYPDPYVPPLNITVQQPPTVFQAQPQPAMWYYCDRPSGYYPYVPDCPSGWRSVPSSPQSGPQPGSQIPPPYGPIK